MLSFYFSLHIIAVTSWIMFLLQFIKSLQHQRINEGYVFGFLSLFFLVVTFYLGIKLIGFNHDIFKSGGWLHLKITLALMLGIENIYYFYKFVRRKKISLKLAEINYWMTYLIFVFILFLTLFRPF